MDVPLVLTAFLGGALLSAGIAYVVLRDVRKHWQDRLAAWKSLSRELPGKPADPLRACRDALRAGRLRGALFDEMAEGLALLDERGNLLLANRTHEEMFRAPIGVGLDSPVLDLGERRELEKAHRSAIDREKASTLDLRLGTTPPREILVTLTPHRTAEGRPAAILTALDVTTRKRAEQVRTEFVANVSHELRTPLAAIRGYVETCLEPHPEGQPPPYRRFLGTVYQHTLRLSALIEDLLVLSRIESKATPLKIESISLHPCVEATLSTLGKEAEKKNVRLRNALPTVLPNVRADRTGLERILLNLVENAIKYSDEDSPVEVSARLQSGQMLVLVRDEGVGIPKDDQERVFERFYRVDKARSRAAGGTGLGLSIVKHLVQAHGGEVWVDSVPGRGSTFFFTLPVALRAGGTGDAAGAETGGAAFPLT